MKKFTQHLHLLTAALLFTCFSSFGQMSASAGDPNTNHQTQTTMKTYVIERNIPGAGQFTAEKLKDISKTSCSVLKDMGPGIQWIQSYVTDNKIFCVYKAESIELLKEHAKKGGFPINNVYEVENVISPATAQ
ncbi:MAG TPA: DUF4242 domain-containing protein [Puia sp.]|nr:DUF4242 domain-containing protein [Puia sp.]